MGAFIAKAKANFEADDFFSYTTVKLVVIKDRRLGIIHYVLQFAIFIYIVVYTILYEQRYLKLEAPYGSVRATIQEPPSWPTSLTPSSNLPYCNQSDLPYQWAGNKYDCAYITGTDLTFPPGTADTLLIGTRLKYTYYSTPPSHCDPYLPPTSPECAPTANRNLEHRYYIAGIEDYTLYMEHAVFGRLNELVLSNVDCEGSIIFHSSHPAVKFNDKTRTGDTVPLSTLLTASDIKLDDPSGLGKSFRYDGALIVVVVTYTNDITNPNKLKYTYEFFNIPKQDVVAKQPISATPEGNIQKNWNGVRFVFMIVGSIGVFDFPTLLTSLVAGTVLLSVATTVVDMLMQHIMPDKKYYSDHKFEETCQMTKFRKERENSSKALTPNERPLLAEDYGADDHYMQHM